jgi:hypothetical protein
MARKQNTEKTEPTPFDGIGTGLPACVIAANSRVQTDGEQPDAPDRPARPAAASVVTGRREYTREDFAAAAGGWVSGFACKRCGCQDMRVHRTERCLDSAAVVRTRVCRNCGEKVKTVEQ